MGEVNTRTTMCAMKIPASNSMNRGRVKRKAGTSVVDETGSSVARPVVAPVSTEADRILSCLTARQRSSK
jgi:hypothetical protein